MCDADDVLVCLVSICFQRDEETKRSLRIRASSLYRSDFRIVRGQLSEISPYGSTVRAGHSSVSKEAYIRNFY